MRGYATPEQAERLAAQLEPAEAEVEGELQLTPEQDIAAAESRAERRHKQLIEKGISASISSLLQDLRARDARDASRSA